VMFGGRVAVSLPFVAYAVLFSDFQFDVVWYYEGRVFECRCVYTSFDRVLYAIGQAFDCQVD
jgi:hypothetical protein